MNLLIIGAGQLGSRHLQGLLKLKLHFNIYVLDPSKTSLKVARDRANEINHSHKVFYINDWKNLPNIFELVVVATGADVRQQVIIELLNKCNVKNLVLEKILFQDLNSYYLIQELLIKTKTPTWVNHPRRMFSHYQNIKKELSKTKEKIIFKVVGGNWDLACNGLHFIDLCSFITDKEVLEIDFEWVDNKIQKSKRNNNIEFTGSIKGRMRDNSCFLITSFENEVNDISINISSGSKRWNIQEGQAQKISYLSKENNFNEKILNIKTEFQSTLTTIIANEIINNGICELPTYEEAMASHIPFIIASLKKYKEITGINTNICPIT